MTSRPIALITGGSRGLGLAIASELAPDYHLLIGARTEQAAAAACARLPSAEPFVADLTDEQQLAAAKADLPDLNVLVHNAAVMDIDPIADVARDRWRATFEANLFAVADLTARALPGLRRRKGQVVLINSSAGFITAPGYALYSSSKFALRAFADTLRDEERKAGVRVSSVHPGRIDTDMQRGMAQKAGTEYQPKRYLTVEAVARAVRAVIDAAPEASLDTVSIQPSPV